MAVDLHSHSTSSDGSETPSSIVKMAVDRGLTALALTDHDTLEGADDADACPGLLPPEVIDLGI